MGGPRRPRRGPRALPVGAPRLAALGFRVDEQMGDVGRPAPETASAAPAADYEPFTVNVRAKRSALWASMLFVFAYVDLFSLYRPDVRADLEAGEIAGFTVNQAFLVGTTAYVVVPSLMVVLSLVLRPRVDRIVNVALGAVYALTVVAGAIGEWGYYVLGSAVEVALLAAIVYYAWTWPRKAPS